ncbi:MAG: urease accessory protein UreD [Methyloceanibacter sp.]
MPPDGSSGAETSAGSSRKLVSGRLDLAFAADGGGRTYLARQYANYPFHVCRALYQDAERPGLATLYLQSCSGGLYEDDRLDMRLEVAPSAEAHVSTQSPTVVHTMPEGAARLVARIACAPKSYLEYLPDPQILFPGSRCASRVEVSLDGDAVALVSDSFLGHDPDGRGGTFANYASEIVIADAAGRNLAIDRLKVDGGSFGGGCPGISGSYAAQGTMIVAGLALPSPSLVEALRGIRPDDDGAAIGISDLPKGAGYLVRILAADGVALKRAMSRAWSAARTVLKGAPPAERRK